MSTEVDQLRPGDDAMLPSRELLHRPA